ncbi:MAG TPA: DUF4139 domain-containing protein [Dissulfurispiraceae bacterium]|nr:DUF4139 domain-containing protein [Dissulfurispiraceae bacterium]
MDTRRHVILAMVFLCASIFPLLSSSAGDQASPVVSTGVEQQSGLSITVYNVNLGLVKDQREINLPPGSGELRFMDVASQIIPASVHVTSLVDPRSLQVLEQNYEYDLLSPQRLLDKYVGRQVKLYQKNPYTEREEMVDATLLSNNGGPVYKIGDVITFGHPGRIMFPGIPEDLISRPTLVWLLSNSLSAPQRLEVSYLTNGINWRADYVVTLNERDATADIEGWVTMDNKSGATYRNAQVKLVAGEVHRVKDEAAYRGVMIMADKAAAMPAAPQFKEEEFFEYHLYTLQRRTTIKENQTKQIRLAEAASVPVKKELVFRGARHYYLSRFADPVRDQKAGVYVEILNKKEHNLGIPLPKGLVRVYKADADKSLQFVGEDSIDHTPKDEKLRVRLGDAFDVVGTRKQTDWKKIAFDTYEAAFEISLRNHKKEDVEVKVVEPIPGDWTVLSSSYPYTKADVHTAEFLIPVPKDSEVTLTYRVRIRY